MDSLKTTEHLQVVTIEHPSALEHEHRGREYIWTATRYVLNLVCCVLAQSTNRSRESLYRLQIAPVRGSHHQARTRTPRPPVAPDASAVAAQRGAVTLRTDKFIFSRVDSDRHMRVTIWTNLCLDSDRRTRSPPRRLDLVRRPRSRAVMLYYRRLPLPEPEPHTV